MDVLQRNFFLIDFAIGAAIPLSIIALHAAKKISSFTWKLFWIGIIIGLTWEISLSTLNGLGVVNIFNFITPPPVHFIFIIISHSFWDGGIFLVGVALVNIICSEPRFEKFNTRELSILLVWGQAQELAVELLSTGSGGWEYIPSWWNPSLFLFKGSHITLIPQIIWLIAPVFFYYAALRIKKNT